MYSLPQFVQFARAFNKILNENVVTVIYKFLTGFETNFELSTSNDAPCKIQFHCTENIRKTKSIIQSLRNIPTSKYSMTVNKEYLFNQQPSQVIWNFRLLSLGFVWQITQCRKVSYSFNPSFETL